MYAEPTPMCTMRNSTGREIQSPPEEKTHMSELAEEFNFTYMHTPIYLEENVQLMCRMIPGMKKLIFLGDGIYPNPEYDKQLRELIKDKYPQMDYEYISSRTNSLHQL